MRQPLWVSILILFLFVSPAWSQRSPSTVGNADTLDGVDSTEFLRSNTSDDFTSGSLTINDGTSFRILGSMLIADTNDSHTLQFVWNENDTANRILNLLVAGGNRSLTLAENLTIGDGTDITVTGEDNAGAILLDNANFEVENANATQRNLKIVIGTDANAQLTVEATGTIDQDVTSDGNPTFAGATLSGLTATRLVSSDGSKVLTSTDLTSWIAGTAGEVSVADDGDGTATLSFDGILGVAKGGTGKASWTQYAFPYVADSTTLTELGIGAAGEYLKVNATATGYTWATPSGTGDVVGPASATDNAIVRFNGTTGKSVQNGTATIDDNGTVYFAPSQNLVARLSALYPIMELKDTDGAGGNAAGVFKIIDSNGAAVWQFGSWCTVSEHGWEFYDDVNDTLRLFIDSGGNVGINSNDPQNKADIVDNANPQLRLTHTAGTIYTTLQTKADGDLNIVPTGGDVTISDFYVYRAGGTDVPVTDGGTNASTASGARTNLGVAIGSDVQAYDADLSAIAALAKADGNFIVGNGSTWVAESGSTARISIGLGNVENTTLSTWPGSEYLTTLGTITTGVWHGTAISDGYISDTITVGASGSVNDGAIPSGVTRDSEWDTYSELNTAVADATIYASGQTDVAVADGGTGSSTTSGARTNLGLAIGSDVQAYDAGLSAIAGLAKTDGSFIVGNGTTWINEGGSTARASLGLGSIATQDADNVSVTGGSVTGITDLAVADGGTGASTVAGARTNLGLGSTDNPVFGGVNADAINVGITAAGEIDTDSGDLTLDSASGNVLITGSLGIGGRQAFTTISTFGAGDTTPSVAGDNVFKANATGATITAFDDGAAGQPILIIFVNTATIITDGANLNLQGGINFSGTADDTMNLIYDGTSWFEVCRSVN